LPLPSTPSIVIKRPLFIMFAPAFSLQACIFFLKDALINPSARLSVSFI